MSFENINENFEYMFYFYESFFNIYIVIDLFVFF